jgi:hypothetical protein
MLSIFSDESETQTRNIVRHAAFAEANPHINEDIEDRLVLWRKFHDWVSLGNHKVAIPFMSAIIETIERMPVRFRRDLNSAIRSAIQVSSNIPTFLIFILSRLTLSPSLFIILAQTNWIQYNIVD